MANSSAAAKSPPPKIEAIYIAKDGTAKMQSIQEATLLTKRGIVGDRYCRSGHTRTGTYSARWLDEPGRDLTLVSADGFEAILKEQKLERPITVLRRNIVVRGLSADAVNDMVGHEVQLGPLVRLFVHRRTVPCKYREAQARCANFMNHFWQACGVSCEILQGGSIQVGDTMAVVPHSHHPERCSVGLKPPGFFKKPADRSLADVKGAIIPVPLAICFSLLDPLGFERVETGYNSVGQQFFSPRAYRVGIFVKDYIRTPLLLSVGVAVVSVVVGVASKLV